MTDSITIKKLEQIKKQTRDDLHTFLTPCFTNAFAEGLIENRHSPEAILDAIHAMVAKLLLAATTPNAPHDDGALVAALANGYCTADVKALGLMYLFEQNRAFCYGGESHLAEKDAQGVGDISRYLIAEALFNKYEMMDRLVAYLDWREDDASFGNPVIKEKLFVFFWALEEPKLQRKIEIRMQELPQNRKTPFQTRFNRAYNANANLVNSDDTAYHDTEPEPDFDTSDALGVANDPSAKRSEAHYQMASNVLESSEAPIEAASILERVKQKVERAKVGRRQKAPSPDKDFPPFERACYRWIGGKSGAGYLGQTLNSVFTEMISGENRDRTFQKTPEIFVLAVKENIDEALLEVIKRHMPAEKTVFYCVTGDYDEKASAERIPDWLNKNAHELFGADINKVSRVNRSASFFWEVKKLVGKQREVQTVDWLLDVFMPVYSSRKLYLFLTTGHDKLLTKALLSAPCPFDIETEYLGNDGDKIAERMRLKKELAEQEKSESIVCLQPFDEIAGKQKTEKLHRRLFEHIKEEIDEETALKFERSLWDFYLLRHNRTKLANLHDAGDFIQLTMDNLPTPFEGRLMRFFCKKVKWPKVLRAQQKVTSEFFSHLQFDNNEGMTLCYDYHKDKPTLALAPEQNEALVAFSKKNPQIKRLSLDAKQEKKHYACFFKTQHYHLGLNPAVSIASLAMLLFGDEIKIRGKAGKLSSAGVKAAKFLQGGEIPKKFRNEDFDAPLVKEAFGSIKAMLEAICEGIGDDYPPDVGCSEALARLVARLMEAMLIRMWTDSAFLAKHTKETAGFWSEYNKTMNRSMLLQ